MSNFWYRWQGRGEVGQVGYAGHEGQTVLPLAKGLLGVLKHEG